MKQTGRMYSCVVALAALLTACAAPRTNMEIAVAPDGAVTVADERVQLRRLPAELKSRGATRATGIYVTVPPHASPQLLREITETLATAGYARVIFTKPRKASVATAE